MASKAWSIKEKNNDKLDFVKNEKLCTSKDNIKKMKRQAADLEKIFAIPVSEKGLAFRIFENLLGPGVLGTGKSSYRNLHCLPTTTRKIAQFSSYI